MEDISHIFRSYDVRGIYGKDIDEEVMKRIGNAFSDFSKNAVIGRDMRLSSRGLSKAFAEGLTDAGASVTDVGLLPLGVAMFHAWRSKKDLAYITASHLPKEWNGVKFFHSNGLGFLENENRKIRNIVVKEKHFQKPKGRAVAENSRKIIHDYVSYLAKKMKAERKARIAMDFGNGAAALAGHWLFRKCGFEVVPVFEKLDGTFPSRDPEPQEDDLLQLKKTIESNKCDLGIAYDGDGDRMLLVSNDGRKLSAEQASYLILSELLKKQKGPIVANIECTRLVDHIAGKFSRKVRRIPVGHTFLVSETRKSRACFGLETSGHYIIPSVLPFDDALAVSLYAACALSKKEKSAGEIIDELPKYYFERVSMECSDKKKFLVIDRLRKKFKEQYKKVMAIDGVRIDFPYGWVLIRASNTSPMIRMTVEAGSSSGLEKLKAEFLGMLQKETGKTGMIKND
ncbi:MAG: hypothetical protein HYW26_02230 [Candidatus Aenigmarchaeota archaeon]|nr:hypothetical protein [Candidatus Aenigmarchaeota archaeon]